MMIALRPLGWTGFFRRLMTAGRAVAEVAMPDTPAERCAAAYLAAFS